MSFLKSVLDNPSNYILCSYINITNRIQIVRITNIPSYHWEQVIFPGQRLIFEAITSALLEIHTSENVTAIVNEVIPCQQLRVIDEPISVKRSLLTISH